MQIVHASHQASATSRVEVADVFRTFGPAWLEQNPIPARHQKVVRAIVACRSAALGGQRYCCRGCGYQRYVYHSCRNRHCPKCQTLAKERWREARQRELLPVPYFHQVFTVPHLLNRLVLWSEKNQRALLKLLFDATAQTLLEFGRRNFSGQVGFTLILHTWDQRLRPHFHVHCLMPSGALANGGGSWIAGGSRYLFPVRALSKVFRGKFLEGLRRLIADNALDLPADLKSPPQLRRWMRGLRRHNWVVYSKRPMGGPRRVLDYLSRYTHRVAISNNRLLSCADGQVRFTYRDRADGDRRKVETLEAGEFIRRFLHHVLPDRFTRIRHYGFLSSRNKRASLARIRTLLGAKPLRQDQEPIDLAAAVREWFGIDPLNCPCCRGPLEIELLPSVAGPYAPLPPLVHKPP